MGLLDHCFSKICPKMTKNGITWPKFNLFLILNHHRVAFVPKIMAVPNISPHYARGKKFSCAPFSQKVEPDLVFYGHTYALGTKLFRLTLARKKFLQYPPRVRSQTSAEPYWTPSTHRYTRLGQRTTNNTTYGGKRGPKYTLYTIITTRDWDQWVQREVQKYSPIVPRHTFQYHRPLMGNTRLKEYRDDTQSKVINWSILYWATLEVQFISSCSF